MPLSHVFGPEAEWPRQDLIALSADIDATLTLDAYRSGVFPMPLHVTQFEQAMGWWSPMERGVLPLVSFHATRSLRRSMKRYRITVDVAFADVLAGCADPARPGGWIAHDISVVYAHLPGQGVVHPVEAWTPDGELAGGLYGVSIGGLFAGESMFHDPVIGRDASKVALAGLVSILDDGVAGRLLDVQWATEHLLSLGAHEVARTEYLRRLDRALDLPAPHWPKGDLHA